MPNKTYSELSSFKTFEERYEYLKLNGTVGSETFGGNRYLNQKFYNSSEWKTFRRHVILRDGGCDLGISDRPIQGKIYIHHLNPINDRDIIERHQNMLDPNNAICVSFDTHQAIHFGDEKILASDPIKREPNDTAPWRRFDE